MVNGGIEFKNIRLENRSGGTRKFIDLITPSQFQGDVVLDRAVADGFNSGSKMENTILRMRNVSRFVNSGSIEMLATECRLFNSFGFNTSTANTPLFDFKNSVIHPTVKTIFICDDFQYSSKPGPSQDELIR